MKVTSIIINYVKDALIGYVKIVYTDAEGLGTEKMMNNLTAMEIYNLLNREAKAYFKIGEYWTIIV